MYTVAQGYVVQECDATKLNAYLKHWLKKIITSNILRMKIKSVLLITSLVMLAASGFAQVMPKEELIYLTSEWKGERFTDGRPKVSDELIERAKNIGFESAWT